MDCHYCGLNFATNYKHQKFCSKHCAGNANQRKFRAAHKGKCACGATISLRAVRCRICAVNPKRIVTDTTTLEALQKLDKNPYYWANRARIHARVAAFKAIPKPRCFRCNYDLHVEVCHIQPLASFHKTTSLGEVNSLTNLCFLCPNCHWEFDNKRIVVNSIASTPRIELGLHS